MTSSVVHQATPAICVRNAYKRYGPTNIILSAFNMTVTKGTIYAMLGASGCGKTTLLSCIVGTRKLDSGDIWALGGKPCTRSSGVPGPRLGYMPQASALYGDFNIQETMIYFGWIGGMSTEKVNVRLEFLVRLLDLPSLTRPVKDLSGGQQRRVSFAVALLHDPELLVLDEPTVGLDPVLRQNIWNHLAEITKTGKKTVLITTHYIEEARQVNIMGLMRGGKLLDEDTSDSLLRRYEVDNLEDVFLKLATNQNQTDEPKASTFSDRGSSALQLEDCEHHEISAISKEKGLKGDKNSDRRGSLPFSLPKDDLPEPLSCWNQISPVKVHRMKALVWKNSANFLRNYGMMAFIILLPIIEIVTYCTAIGHDPKGLKVNVVNYELGPGHMFDKCEYDKDTCFGNRSSCHFLHYYSQGNSDLVSFESVEVALANAKLGKAVVVMIFQANFSQALASRMMDARSATNEELLSSSIRVHIDNTNTQTESMLKRDIYDAFDKFCNAMADLCHMPKRYFRQPVKFHEPVYGGKNLTFTDFCTPSMMLTAVFFLSLSLTSGALLVERNEGIFERLLVCGVTGTEILLSHSIVQMVVMAEQAVSIFICGFMVFDLTCKGPFQWVVALIFMVGFCGMSYGVLISTVCNTEQMCIYMSLGSFMPMLLLSGAIWPVEGMPKTVQYFSKLLPIGTASDSLRSMLQRGWSIDRPIVYTAFASISAWIALFFFVSIVLIKYKRA